MTTRDEAADALLAAIASAAQASHAVTGKASAAQAAKDLAEAYSWIMSKSSRTS